MRYAIVNMSYALTDHLVENYRITMSASKKGVNRTRFQRDSYTLRLGTSVMLSVRQVPKH
jgi:hypothetical protein